MYYMTFVHNLVNGFFERKEIKQLFYFFSFFGK